MVKKIISICAAGMIVASCSPKKTTAQPTDPSTTDSELTMLVGTYTSGNSKGIYTFRIASSFTPAIRTAEIST